jgi:hypothetical protein
MRWEFPFSISWRVGGGGRKYQRIYVGLAQQTCYINTNIFEVGGMVTIMLVQYTTLQSYNVLLTITYKCFEIAWVPVQDIQACTVQCLIPLYQHACCNETDKRFACQLSIKKYESLGFMFVTVNAHVSCCVFWWHFLYFIFAYHLY